MVDKAGKQPVDASTMEKVEAAVLGQGLIVRLVGNRVCLSPPQIITEQELNVMFERLNTALSEVFVTQLGETA